MPANNMSQAGLSNLFIHQIPGDIVSVLAFRLLMPAKSFFIFVCVTFADDPKIALYSVLLFQKTRVKLVPATHNTFYPILAPVPLHRDVE